MGWGWGHESAQHQLGGSGGGLDKIPPSAPFRVSVPVTWLAGVAAPFPGEEGVSEEQGRGEGDRKKHV